MAVKELAKFHACGLAYRMSLKEEIDEKYPYLEDDLYTSNMTKELLAKYLDSFMHFLSMLPGKTKPQTNSSTLCSRANALKHVLSTSMKKFLAASKGEKLHHHHHQHLNYIQSAAGLAVPSGCLASACRKEFQLLLLAVALCILVRSSSSFFLPLA